MGNPETLNAEIAAQARNIKMEALGVLGFIFGSGAMFFGIVAWSQISVLRKEFEDLKNSLEKSGKN